MRNKKLLIGIFVTSIVSPIWAATFIVDPNGLADYTTIQAAIDNSSNNDEIIVRQGTYYETINTNNIAITLRSTNPDDPYVIVNTIIDANGVGTVITCNSGEDSNTIIEGFIITGGNATFGGGIYCINNSSPTVRNCTFAKNISTDEGGGMHCDSSDPILINCTFIDNNAISGDGAGGGIYFEDTGSGPILINCIFIGNDASSAGGGIHCTYSSPELTNCKFIDNEASEQGGNGGGIYCELDSSPTLNNCWFTNNIADKGGAIYFSSNSDATINYCTFTDNEAECEGVTCASIGGGIYCDTSSPILNKCKFTHNGADNGGGGIYSSLSNPELNDTVVSENYPDQINGSYADNGGNIIGQFLPPVPPLGGYQGDLDGNGVVNFVDFAIFANNWLIGTELID